MNTQFIDLGLPSGTLWAAENASKPEDKLFTFEEAKEAFPDSLPARDAWAELAKECAREWDQERGGYILTGPNGNTLFLPAVEGSAEGLYWSSSMDASADGGPVAFLLHFTPETFNPEWKSFTFMSLSVRLCLFY